MRCGPPRGRGWIVEQPSHDREIGQGRWSRGGSPDVRYAPRTEVLDDDRARRLALHPSRRPASDAHPDDRGRRSGLRGLRAAARSRSRSAAGTGGVGRATGGGRLRTLRGIRRGVHARFARPVAAGRHPGRPAPAPRPGIERRDQPRSGAGRLLPGGDREEDPLLPRDPRGPRARVPGGGPGGAGEHRPGDDRGAVPAGPSRPGKSAVDRDEPDGVGRVDRHGAVLPGRVRVRARRRPGRGYRRPPREGAGLRRPGDRGPEEQRPDLHRSRHRGERRQSGRHPERPARTV